MRRGIILAVLALWISLSGVASGLTLDLNKALDLASKKNPKLREAMAAVEAAKAKLIQAESLLYPKIDFQTTKLEKSKTEAGFPEFPPGLNPSPADQFLYELMKGVVGGLGSSMAPDYQANISLTYPLYLGGKRSALIKSAKENLLSELEKLREVKQEVFYSVNEAYYKLLKAKSMLSLARDTKKQLEAHLREVKALVEVGIASRSDLLRVEVALANADLGIIRAEHAVKLARLGLKFAIGLNIDEDIKVKEELGYSPIGGELSEYLKEAYSRRPEILSVQHLISALKASERAALADYRPQLLLSANYQWSGDTFPPEDNSWNVALVLSFKLFDGGETKGKVKEARANLRKLEATFENLKKGVALEVESAYLSVKEAEKRIKVAGAQVEKALEDFRIAEEEYKAGVGTNIDVLDAQTAWKEMKVNYIQALYDANVAVAKLLLAIGRDRH
ncbi:MAG: TolC family protein [Synergistetes bacterium]|nr:TolC family protein [Synergistota bacterium]